MNKKIYESPTFEIETLEMQDLLMASSLSTDVDGELSGDSIWD